MNPIARVIAAVIAVLVFAGAFFFGLVLLAVIIGLGLLAWIGIRLRMWWIMRQMPAAETASSHPAPGKSEAIDAEYTVVSKKQDP